MEWEGVLVEYDHILATMRKQCDPEDISKLIYQQQSPWIKVITFHFWRTFQLFSVSYGSVT